ncbi:MAG: hypothetical protein ACM3PZ_00825 [Bacillota bacterium]
MVGFKQRLRRIWLTLLGLIVVFFVFEIVSPSGSWTCHEDYAQRGQNLFNRSCLGRPSPGERVAHGPGAPLLVLADPVYFSVFSPRAFSQAEVTITYRPYLSSSTPLIETGFLADKDLWRYRLRPVYNLWLEQGMGEFSLIDEGGLRLYQRTPTFTSVSSFLDAWQKGQKVCPNQGCLAVYNIDLAGYSSALNLSALDKGSGETFFPYPLRGAHQFYLYHPGGRLEISASLLDRNNDLNKDDAEFILFSGRHQALQVKIEDRRAEAELSGDNSAPEPIRLTGELEAGLYRLEFRAGDDLSLSGLKVNSRYLSAINKIWPDGPSPVTLYTDSRYLQAKAIDPAVLQAFDFGGTKLDLDEIYVQKEAVSKRLGLKKIALQSGGILLENNGVFAADPSSLISPDYPRLDRFAPDLSALDIVVSDYRPAKKLEEGWLQSTAVFQAGDLYREKGRYSLVVSAPGIKIDSGAGGLVEIKEITVRFSGKNLLDKIRSLLSL